jgi:excisionase family DNA binding protein
MNMHGATSTFERRNYRISEFSQVYGIGRTKTYQEIKAGRLGTFKVGRITLISREAAEMWQASFSSKGVA